MVVHFSSSSCCFNEVMKHNKLLKLDLIAYLEMLDFDYASVFRVSILVCHEEKILQSVQGAIIYIIVKKLDFC